MVIIIIIITTRLTIVLCNKVNSSLLHFHQSLISSSRSPSFPPIISQTVVQCQDLHLQFRHDGVCMCMCTCVCTAQHASASMNPQSEALRPLIVL